MVRLPAEGARLLLRTIDSIVKFAQDFPIEFTAYCKPERFERVLKTLATTQVMVRTQLDRGDDPVTVPEEAALSLLDMEECISAAKDKRVDNTRLAFITLGGGSLAAWLTGFDPIATVASFAGVGFLLAKPFVESTQLAESDVFRQSLSGGAAETASPGWYVAYNGPGTLGTPRRKGPFC